MGSYNSYLCEVVSTFEIVQALCSSRATHGNYHRKARLYQSTNEIFCLLVYCVVTVVNQSLDLCVGVGITVCVWEGLGGGGIF